MHLFRLRSLLPWFGLVLCALVGCQSSNVQTARGQLPAESFLQNPRPVSVHAEVAAPSQRQELPVTPRVAPAPIKTVSQPVQSVPLPAPAPVPQSMPEVVIPQPMPVATEPCTTCGTAEVAREGGFATRFVGALADVLCNPDPCYQPKWIPLADTAFFTDSARPVSHTRLRWDYSQMGAYMDRGEYYWARSDGSGKGVRPVNAIGVPRLDAHELQQYTETATGGRFSAFFATPYRSLNMQYADPSSSAGFGDITIGTKGVLFDTELLLLTLQFKTILPVGQPAKGLGTGHVSLEPSLLFGVRISPESYLQGQVAEWIPIAGDPTYSGAMLHYHLAYNHTIWRPIPQAQLVGTLELHGYAFQDGGFTDPATGFRPASSTHYLQMGPGARWFFCDQYDFGVGSSFGITGSNSFGSQLRFEFRMRF
jgi:Putative MetA-pathway of phenol degradation